MTLKHSPGPWVFDEWDFAIYSEHATIATFASDDLPTEADGRLIAAAPTMLRLLRVLVPISESGAEDSKELRKWNAALKEASELIARLDGDT